MKRLFILLTFVTGTATAQPVHVTVDLSRVGAPLAPVWTYFGCDEPNYTYSPDGLKLLSELSALSPAPVYMRVHNLLTTGDGQPALKWGSTNAYTEDSAGRPVYDWRITDSIFDAFLQRGIRPIAEVGFMPEALSVHPEPYRHHWKPGSPYKEIYTGWAYPPRDYTHWGALVYAWVRHCVDRYGAVQVATWWWEVWNEPNIGYWQGTAAAYDSLYDYTARAVRRALPGAKVGGPASTGPSWEPARVYLQRFLEHCHSAGVPLDFISFHAKGSPRLVDRQVHMNMAPELSDLATGFQVVSTSPYAALPILITECDPEGCAACSMATNPENAYRNGTAYSAYTAASFSRLNDLATRYHVHLEGAVTWAFTFEGQRWFDGFRDLATNGIDKPVMNVFRMFGLMAGRRLSLTQDRDIPLDSLVARSVHGALPDVHAVGSLAPGCVSVLVWNYHDDLGRADTSAVSLAFLDIPATRVTVREYRVDETHSNAYSAWQRMGSPASPTPEQFAVLERDGALQLMASPQTVAVSAGRLEWRLALPMRGVSLVQLVYER